MNSILDDLPHEDKVALEKLASDLCLKAYFAAGRAKDPSTGMSLYGSCTAKEEAAKRFVKIVLDAAMSPFPDTET